MYWRTRNFTFTTALIDALLNALDTVPGAALLTTPKIELYDTGPPPVPGMALASYTDIAFAGYAAAAVVLTGPVQLGGNDRGMICSVSFVKTAGANGVALGYLLTDGVATVYGGEAFSGPLSFAAVGDFLDVDLIIPLPSVFAPVVV